MKSFLYTKYIFNQHIKILRNPEHKFSGRGTFPTLYTPNGFCAVSGSFSEVILMNASLLPDFFYIIYNSHNNTFFLSAYLLCLVISEESHFPSTFPNISKRSFSPTLIGSYFLLREIRKMPSLSSFNFLI